MSRVVFAVGQELSCSYPKEIICDLLFIGGKLAAIVRQGIAVEISYRNISAFGAYFFDQCTESVAEREYRIPNLSNHLNIR